MSVSDLPFRIPEDSKFTRNSVVSFREHLEVCSQVDDLASDLGRDSAETLRMLLRLGLKVARSVAPQKPTL